jgi:hypothetical protein
MGRRAIQRARRAVRRAASLRASVDGLFRRAVPVEKARELGRQEVDRQQAGVARRQAMDHPVAGPALALEPHEGSTLPLPPLCCAGLHLFPYGPSARAVHHRRLIRRAGRPDQAVDGRARLPHEAEEVPRQRAPQRVGPHAGQAHCESGVRTPPAPQLPRPRPEAHPPRPLPRRQAHSGLYLKESSGRTERPLRSDSASFGTRLLPG